MPMKRKNIWALKIKNSETIIEMAVDLTMTFLRYATSYGAKYATNTGISPKGSTTKKSVKNTVGINVDSGIALHYYIFHIKNFR